MLDQIVLYLTNVIPRTPILIRKDKSRMWLALQCGLALAASLAGCASVTVTPVQKTDTTTPGVRYYQSEPYLLVTKDVPKPLTNTEPKPAKKDKTDPAEPQAPTAAQTPSPPTYTIQVVFLPNYKMGYAVQVKAGFGTINGNMKLANGWQLTEFGAIADTKIPETITAVTGLAKELGALALKANFTITQIPGEEAKAIGLLPGLYRLTFDEDKGYVNGWEPVFLFRSEPK